MRQPPLSPSQNQKNHILLHAVLKPIFIVSRSIIRKWYENIWTDSNLMQKNSVYIDMDEFKIEVVGDWFSLKINIFCLNFNI